MQVEVASVVTTVQQTLIGAVFMQIHRS